uniref:Galectin n=1 Tax=Meloidogyne enterolobii TaxID=390850 RepID=A0A6V7WBD3_MELEN|nr:unnamed protein product [Meloidogyne enterolobii]
MKLLPILLLIICASFMVTMIETATCNNPIIYKNLNLPATINLTKLSFGRGFLPNKSIEINGLVLPRTNEFVINLFEDGVMQQTADIPFHFNPRFLVNPTRVVRNNWIRNRGWGREETSGVFRFRAGRPFILEFVAAPNNTIIIYVNDRHFATFSRVDLSKISQLYINGINTIRVHNLTLCPNPLTTTTTTKEPTTTTVARTRPPPLCLGLVVLDNMETPTVLHIEKLGFGGPSSTPIRVRIIVRGTPLAQPESFNINFGTSGKMLVDGNVLFHFSPRFDIKQVIRNTWTVDKGWEQEERSGGFPFKVGEQFDVEFIISTSPINTIEVYVNNKFFYQLCTI